MGLGRRECMGADELRQKAKDNPSKVERLNSVDDLDAQADEKDQQIQESQTEREDVDKNKKEAKNIPEGWF